MAYWIRCPECGGSGYDGFDPDNYFCSMCGGGGQVEEDEPEYVYRIEATDPGVDHWYPWYFSSSPGDEPKVREAYAEFLARKADGWYRYSKQEFRLVRRLVVPDPEWEVVS